MAGGEAASVGSVRGMIELLWSETERQSAPGSGPASTLYSIKYCADHDGKFRAAGFGIRLTSPPLVGQRMSNPFHLERHVSGRSPALKRDEI